MKPKNSPSHDRSAKEHEDETQRNKGLVRQIPAGVSGATAGPTVSCDSRLSGKQRKLLNVVKNKSKASQGWASTTTIAHDLQIEPKSVSDLAYPLINKGYLVTKKVKTEAGYWVRLYTVQGVGENNGN